MTIGKLHTASARPPALTVLAVVRDALRQRRLDWAEYRTLQRELASYTPAEINDLLGSMRRAETPEAEVTRSIIAANARRSRLAS